MTRMASVSHTRWAFYEAFEVDDKESMADWFETLYHHYQKRGKKIKFLLKNSASKEAKTNSS